MARTFSRAEEDDDGIWAGCDRCGQWRHLLSHDGPLPETWYCEMSPDERYNRCAYPEQEWD